MSDLRARLADALGEHVRDRFSPGFTCTCGWDTNDKLQCEHVADVLLSLPGIAIVELPSTGTAWFDDGWAKFDEAEIDPFNPEQLRRCAAILLAAANRADPAVARA